MAGPERGRYAYFSAEEYQRRQNRASELMEENNVDALFILQSENLLYFTGYTSWLKASKHRPFVAILPKGKEPILVLPRLQLGDAEGFSHVKDIRLWSSDYLEFYADTLRGLGLAPKRIGVEIGHDTHLAMSLLEFEQLKGMLPDASWVDGTDLIFDVRKIKSPAEIEYLRKASEIADKAVENTWSILRPGMTERDVFASMASTFVQEGAEEIGFVIIRSTPEDLYMRNKMPTDRVLQPGDVISCDIGCQYRGYWSDMMRAAAIGEPAEEMATGFAAAKIVNTAVREAARPGMVIGDLDKVRAKTIEEHGYGTWLPSIGHCLGTTVHELPRIAGGVEAILEPGMVFTVEPGVFFDPYVFNIEDVLVVTDDEVISLNKYPRDLYIAS